MSIRINQIAHVTRGIPFDIFINIEGEQSPGSIDITSVVFKPIGTLDSGLTLEVIFNKTLSRIRLSGEYKDLYNQDYVIYVSKGAATRIVEGYTDTDGLYVKPTRLSDELFAEQKLKFPTLVQPTIITSIDNLPDGQDLIFAMADERVALSRQYDMEIKYNEINISDNTIISSNAYTDIITHTVSTSTQHLQQVLQNYYGTADSTVAYSNSTPVVVTEDNVEVTRVLELKSSHISINEGESITITLNTSIAYNVPTLIGYTITGISSSDITIPLTGNFTFDSSITTSVITIPIVTDLLTEGPETLIFSLNDSNLSVSVVIKDTSQSSIVVVNIGDNPVSGIVLLDNTGKPLVDSAGIVLTTTNINFTPSQINTLLGSI